MNIRRDWLSGIIGVGGRRLDHGRSQVAQTGWRGPYLLRRMGTDGYTDGYTDGGDHVSAPINLVLVFNRAWGSDLWRETRRQGAEGVCE
jgi:hypothetical protein